MSGTLSAHNLLIFDNATFVENPQWHHDPVKENRSPPSNSPDSNRPLSIDAEILEVEAQINQLSKKLDALKIKKSGVELPSRSTPSSAAKIRGRIVPAKFLNLETPPRTTPAIRRGPGLGPSNIYQNATPFCARKPLKGIKEEEVRRKDLAVSRRRGMSIGPADVCRNSTTPFQSQRPPKGEDLAMARRRGMSLGPSEILKQARIGQEVREKGSSSTSPRPRRSTTLKISELRNGVSTVGAKKSVKMDEGSIRRVKPKTLFQEPLKSLTKFQNSMSSKVSSLRSVSTFGAKKMVKMDEGSISGVKPKALFSEEKKRPSKNAKVRIVASRYSLANSSVNVADNKRRKWSLPEEREKDEKKNGARRKRCFSLGGAYASQLKEEISPPPSIVKIAETLPKIRTSRCVTESPRDSGCAKRVADLVGKKPCFDESSLSSSCQSLKFEDGEDH